MTFPGLLVVLMGLFTLACGTPSERASVVPPTATATQISDTPTAFTQSTVAPAITSAFESSPTRTPGDAASGSPTIVPTQLSPASTADQPATSANSMPVAEPTLQSYPIPRGSRPHDVAPAVDGGVWYTAQGLGELGWLDPNTGETVHIPLGRGSRPHGVIVGPDGAPWITDGGLNAIVRVAPDSREVKVYPLPLERPNANLNTATFDNNGVLWFTGQNGVYGRLNPATGIIDVFDSPRGRGPYGIVTTPEGEIYYASLAGSYVGRIDLETGEATVLEPPTSGQGARRVWSDSQGRIWVSQWNAGQLALYDPVSGNWTEWKLPGSRPRAYAVYVDENDMIWLSDFGTNAVLRFDPQSQEFESFDMPSNPSNVRQILGRLGEVWLPESAADQLVVIRY